jgi:hypothetical protein
MSSISRARPKPSPKRRAAPSPLIRLRKLCLGLPEAHEVEAWGEPTFRVRNKLFAMYAAANNHHGGGRPAAPKRFFVPVNWSELADLLRDSYRLVAPKRLRLP